MLTRILAAALAGVALALSFEPVAAAWLSPLAVAGYVLATRGLRARRAWVPGLVFGVAFYFPHIHWMTAVGTDAWLALASIEAVFYGLLGPLSAVLQRRRGWPVWVAAAWVAVEVWRSGWPFSGMPWGRLAFGVVDTPAAAALPYVGSVGVSFLLALLGCTLAGLVVSHGTRRRVAVAGLVATLAVMALPVLAPWHYDADGELSVAAVQGDVPGPGNDILYDFRRVTANHVDATVDLGEQVDRGAAPRPDLVVWPENSTAVDPFADATTNAGILAAVRAVGAPVLVGAIVDAGEDHVLNQGIVWDPVTGAGDRYTKRHPVPYGEYIPFRRFFDDQNFGRLALISRDMLSGTRSEPLRVGDVEVADAICFDVAYDDGITAQLTRGARLLVVQTSNATFINTHQIDQQFAITRMRAIETGRWLVVAATNGVSGVIAPDGRVVASAAPRTRAVLQEQVQLSSQVTPAMRLGPWTGRVLTALTALGLLLGLLPYRRGERRGPAEERAERDEQAGSGGRAAAEPGRSRA